MELNDLIALRESLIQVARQLHDIQLGMPASKLQRCFRQCAARLEATAQAIPGQGVLAPYLQPEVAAVARGLDDSLGMKHGNSARMLALLLAQPGVTHSSHSLAMSLGIAHASVRVFAFHLRKWLATQGLDGTLECNWGAGYAISPSSADQLLRKSFHLRSLVAVLRQTCREMPLGPATAFAAKAGESGPLPITRQRTPMGVAAC